MNRILKLTTTAAVALFALTLTSCEQPDCQPCPKPEKKEAKGVEILLEAEDVVTGAVTRLTKGDTQYKISSWEDGSGDIQIKGLGFHRTENGSDRVKVNDLEYHAKQFVLFQGWSWRYVDDPEGTHRGNSSLGSVLDASVRDDFIQAVSYQTESGVNKLMLDQDKISFVAKYRPNSPHNKVLVKFKYQNLPLSPSWRISRSYQLFIPSDYVEAMGYSVGLWDDRIGGMDNHFAILSFQQGLARMFKSVIENVKEVYKECLPSYTYREGISKWDYTTMHDLYPYEEFANRLCEDWRPDSRLFLGLNSICDEYYSKLNGQNTEDMFNIYWAKCKDWVRESKNSLKVLSQPHWGSPLELVAQTIERSMHFRYRSYVIAGYNGSYTQNTNITADQFVKLLRYFDKYIWVARDDRLDRWFW